jgi:hypothetical protein
MPLIVVR